MKNPKFLLLIATFFNIGKVPKAPGTVATLATIPVFILMSHLSDVAYLVLVFAITILGIFAAQAYEAVATEHDSKEIVIDEVAGFLITMAMIPCTIKSVIIGFILFRLFDIFKPWPISVLDKKVKGGVGVMVDDIAAGIIANILMQLILTYYPWILL
ncbi:MAG: phosphatidylglycerophosphatase A [Bdellovibrionaceae bacterium]|nr:phosphatidylglycerophosphatase A [Pseudobdellovibrionaceae bacterium]